MAAACTGCSPKDTETMAQAESCLELGDYENAVLMYDQAIEEGKQLQACYRGKGIALMGQMEYENAAETFRKALDSASFIERNLYRDKMEDDIRKYLASCYIHVKRYEDAILIYDALIEKEIGKSISGAGMDTNIVGRYSSTTASGGPKIKTMGVLDLTEDSHGNANGMGLADFITKRLYDKTDLETVYMNALTSTATVLSKIPMILEKDEYVFRACAKHSGRLDPEDIRLVIIKSTKELGEVYMSRAAYEANIDPEHCRLESDFFEIPFDEEGNLLLF